MGRSVGFVIFPDAEELDFVGPWEVFSMLAEIEPESCRPFLVSQYGGEVRCAKGLRVIAEHRFASCPPTAVLLVPGGRGTRFERDNPAMTAFLARVGAGADVVASVCTGAFLLERAGFLDGRRATTHWASMEQLRQLGTVAVVEQRWVDDGKVVTAAGVSAGIDMSLHLVGRLWTKALARKVQHAMEYFPEPPYQDVPLPAWD
jgi:transcriptional regulator GlxA family with amidase domain